VYQSRAGASGEIRFNCEVHPYAHGESVIASSSDRPALCRASGGFFQGGGTGANQYRAANRITGRLLNLKDELSLIMELLLAGA
jgi:hypothetical protein